MFILKQSGFITLTISFVCFILAPSCSQSSPQIRPRVFWMLLEMITSAVLTAIDWLTNSPVQTLYWKPTNLGFLTCDSQDRQQKYTSE